MVVVQAFFTEHVEVSLDIGSCLPKQIALSAKRFQKLVDLVELHAHGLWHNHCDNFSSTKYFAITSLIIVSFRVFSIAIR